MNPYILISTSYAGMITYGIAYAEYDDGRAYLIEVYPDLSPLQSRVQQLVDFCNDVHLPRHRLHEAVSRFLEAS